MATMAVAVAAAAAARLLGAGARAHRPVTAAMAMSAIRVTGVRVKPPQRHFSSSNNNGDDRDDEELQQSFRGLYGKLRTVASLSMDQIDKAFEEMTVVTPVSPYVGLKLLVELQNPLLKKYKFNISDFMSGAKQAVLEVKGALGSREYVDMRVSGRFKRNETTDFLRETLSHHLFPLVCFPGGGGGDGKNKRYLTSVDLVAITVTRVDTIVVDEHFLKMRKDVIDLVQKMVRVSKDVLRTPLNDAPDAVEVDDVMANADGTLSAGLGDSRGPEYPIGSVLAQVDVKFITHDEFHNPNAPEDEKTRERLDNEKWTFEACISGHGEQRWVVSQFHGMGAINVWRM